MKNLKKLNKYFLKYKYHFVGGIIITIASQIFTMFAPQYVANIINGLQDFGENVIDKEQVVNLLYRNILFIIATTLFAGFLSFCMRQTIIVMSRHVEFDMKNEIYDQYQKLSQDFYKKNKTGDLMSRISEDVAKVRQYVGPAVMYSINTFIRITVVIVQMYIISPKLTFYALIPVPFLGYFIAILSKQINRKSFLYQQNLSNLSSFSQEIFSGIRVIKAYALEEQKKDLYDKQTSNSKGIFLELSKYSSLIVPLMVFLIGMSNLLIVYIGAKMYIDGSIQNIGVIAQFILYINMLTWPIASLGWVSTMVQEADASQKRINEFLNEKPAVKNTVHEHSTIEGNIQFKNVSFTYEDTGIKALNNVSFTLEKGKTLAIFGKTGSGKSTIIQLISRMYDVNNGVILIDGTPIEKLNLFDLRNAIAVVPQDAFLFSDTIKNNIKFGKETATDQEIVQYAKLADVHRNIEGFENKYETILGERGLTLSGGQKQRVSIARALIKDAPILLLDDALSAVDTETEERILENLKQVTRDKTTIIVTHRISSAKYADYICVLDEGNIVEYGTHNELIDKKGYYAELYSKQKIEK